MLSITTLKIPSLKSDLQSHLYSRSFQSFRSCPIYQQLKVSYLSIISLVCLHWGPTNKLFLNCITKVLGNFACQTDRADRAIVVLIFS